MPFLLLLPLVGLNRFLSGSAGRAGSQSWGSRYGGGGGSCGDCDGSLDCKEVRPVEVLDGRWHDRTAIPTPLPLSITLSLFSASFGPL